MKNALLRNFIEIDVSKLVKANWNYKEDNDRPCEVKRNGAIINKTFFDAA